MHFSFAAFFFLHQLFIVIHRLNICRKSAVETRELCQQIFKDVYIKCLSEASPDFFHISSTVLNSLWYTDIQLDEDSILALIYRLHGIECKYSIFTSMKHMILFHLNNFELFYV